MSESAHSRPTSSRRFTKSTSPAVSEKSSTDTNEPFSMIAYDQLEQGALYIIKIKQVSLALFEGWNDDMCCFSILRSELEPMRWSETRQLPGDFDVYSAFDEHGNPPIHLWSRYLKTTLPANWFCMFEQSRQRQRLWIRQHPLEEPSSAEAPPEASVSNTDVSSMLLSPHESTLSDPSVSHLDIPSTTTSESSSRSSAEDDAEAAHTPHTKTTTAVIEPRRAISPKSNSFIIDREQIRRHLAPGQATAFSRQSVTTLQAIASLPNTSNPAMVDIGTRPYLHSFPTQPDLARDSLVSISKSPSLPTSMPTEEFSQKPTKK
ncbi:hypothetical protein BY458DRAFT_500373 [Sporodiniella umbellata]|nr:hypothetical protein BY458DRAFT_500373 [Sporodiniella umbellata]